MTLINRSGGNNNNSGNGGGNSTDPAMRGSTFHTSNNRDNEFARCTISSHGSSCSNRDSECESIDPRDSLCSRQNYIKTAHFRGTG